MKCEVVRDLLPLYIDKLTSEESNKEIEKHLKSCKECYRYYQEMTGEIEDISKIPKEELRDVKVIKKIKKRGRKKLLAAVIGTALAVFAAVFLFFSFTYGIAKYKDVELRCEVQGNKVYVEMQSQKGYELCFTGYSNEHKSYLKVLGKRKVGNSETSTSSWEGELNMEEPYQYVFEFSDKIITIENGKVVSEKEK